MELSGTFQHTSFTFAINNKSESGYTFRVLKIAYKPTLRSIEIVGNHQAEKSNYDVVGISFKNIKELKTIPYGLTKIFPRLMYIQADNCGLKTLAKKDLTGLDHLRGLWVPNNDITTLDDNVFDHTPGIRILCFYRNLLKFIGPELLKPLKNLTDANFLQNTCINKEYKNGDKEQLDALNREIILKCHSSIEISEENENKLEKIEMKKEIKQLKEQIQKMENRIKVLEVEKIANSQLIASLDILEQTASNMQLRLTEIEDNNQQMETDLLIEQLKK